jgi:O-antigen ligase
MARVRTEDFPVEIEEQESPRGAALLVAHFLGNAIFVSLLVLIVFTAIPYGTVEGWWKAFFVCLVSALCIAWIIEGLLSGSWAISGLAILAPLVALATFSFLQSLPLGTQAAPGISYSSWQAISAAPFDTRFFLLQLLGLIFAAALLFRYVSTERRLGALIHVIIAVAVVSAIYGMLRQTTQHSVGFGLPLIRPGEGYGQFVNKNHFAFLMEMAFGLALGMILAGGVKREKALIYFAAMLPIWTALVLSNSRGGLLAMLAQVIASVLLFTIVVPAPGKTQLPLLKVARMLPVRILLLLVLLTGLVFGTVWMGGDRLATSLEHARDEFDPATTAARLGASRNEIWRASWQMFKAHPTAGVGLGAYGIAIPAYHDASGVLTPQEAHNEYLELLACGGLIGMAIGAWFGVAVFRKTLNNLRSSNRFRRAASFGAALGIIGVAVHSLFEFGLHLIVNALVFAALIVIATQSLRNDDTLQENDV